MSRRIKPTNATEKAAKLVAKAVGECDTPADVVMAFKYGWAKAYVRVIALVAREQNLDDDKAKEVAGELLQDMMNEMTFESIKYAVDTMGMYEAHKRSINKVDEILMEIKDVIDKQLKTTKGRSEPENTRKDPIVELAELLKKYGDSTVH